METIRFDTDLSVIEKLVFTVQELSMATDIESVMKIVRSVARKLTGADGATFVLRENDMCYYAEEDAISPLWKGSRFPMKTCISGWVMMHKKTAIIPDIYQDPRIPIDAYRPTFVKSLVMVPIRRMEPLGAIGNYWASMRMPTDEEIFLLQSLADITAVSIENINIRERLEDKLRERSLMLSELQKQKEKLEEFNQIISHNLRAPLANLQLIGNLITDEKSLKKKLLYIDKQKEVVNSLHNTFEELVDAIKIRKDFNIKKDYIELEKGLSKVLERLHDNILKSHASVTFDFSRVKSVYYPAEYFNSIIINLVSNALRYASPDRDPIIHIKSRKEDGWTFLEVEDNGSGIDLNVHGEKIFKLHKTFHGHPNAKGFGLFITKTKVEALGGNIKVESSVNKGSKFIVQLCKDK